MNSPLRLACIVLCSSCGIPDATARIDTGDDLPFSSTAVAEAALQSSPLPEIPAVERDMVVVKPNQTLSRPHVPPFKTTQDGRVALDNEGRFYVFRPEQLSTHVMDAPNGTSLTTASTAQAPLHWLLNPRASAFFKNPFPSMTAVCDPTTNVPLPGQTRRNPYPCGNDSNPDGTITAGKNDCYDLTIIVTVMGDEIKQWHRNAQIWSVPYTIEIASPKTVAAHIVRAEPDVSRIRHSPRFDVQNMFEPMVTEDGRFFLVRVSNSQLQWPDDNNVIHDDGTLHDSVYSVAPPTAEPCDASAWTQLWPLTHAPYQQAVRQRYGFAKYPFRDPEGYPIADGARFKGTYPWIDRGGKNLFFSLIGPQLYYFDLATGAARTRFEAECLPGVACNLKPTHEEYTNGDFQGGWHYQGMAMAGLWSHGKFVSIDSMLSHIDFPLYTLKDKQRMLRLFEAGTGPASARDQTGWVQAGSGRAVHDRPALTSFNGEMIESIESLFNFNANFRPRTPRDVVWLMSNGKATDEVAFDDSLDLDMLIFADMRASLTQDDPGNFNNGVMRYRDGFRETAGHGWSFHGDGFVDEKRLQNAATTLHLRTPKYGRLASDPGFSSRIEPMALGGIKGKGLWLDSGSRAIFSIEAQPSLAEREWYVSVFVDQRQTMLNDATDLLTFPNGGKVLTYTSEFIGYLSPTGRIFAIRLPKELTHQPKAWNHYGFALRNQGREITFFLNGMKLETVTDAQPILSISAGDLVLGRQGAWQGFRGWVDELKVIGRLPDPELACNHARGFLRGLTDADGAALARARRYPQSTHDEVSLRLRAARRTGFPGYECAHTYQDPDGIPVGVPQTNRLTDVLRFPEGPLVWTNPRPDSTRNTFCLTCHAPGQQGGLSMTALTAGTVNMASDPRRQPFMWPMLQTGNFPANYLAPGVPQTDVTLSGFGVAGFDAWWFR